MRYQYTSPGSRGYRANFNWGIPDGVKIIILINVCVFVLIELSGFRFEIFELFGLVPEDTWRSLKIWQPLTYLFLHSGLFHIFINMFVLWMFGRDLENRWGKKSFIRYFLITGIGSGIVTILFDLESNIPVVGASGAVYGVLMAYALAFPNRLVYLYGLFPVKVKYLIAFLGAAAFLASISEARSTISHLTHLSGMIIGLVYLKKGKLFTNWSRWIPKIKLHSDSSPGKAASSRMRNEDKRKIDAILDKLKENGWDELSENEKQQLFSASKNYTKDQPPN